MKALLVGGILHGVVHESSEEHAVLFIEGIEYRDTFKSVQLNTIICKVFLLVSDFKEDPEILADKLSDALRVANSVHTECFSASNTALSQPDIAAYTFKPVFGKLLSLIPFSVIGKATNIVKGSEKRTVARVAGRTLEETIELCLSAGLTVPEIYGHVADSIHNQYLKASHNAGHTIYPSQPITSMRSLPELEGEIGDVFLLLCDLAYRAQIDIAQAITEKTESFLKKVQAGVFYANENGLLYTDKAHLKRATDND